MLSSIAIGTAICCLAVNRVARAEVLMDLAVVAMLFGAVSPCRRDFAAFHGGRDRAAKLERCRCRPTMTLTGVSKAAILISQGLSCLPLGRKMM